MFSDPRSEVLQGSDNLQDSLTMYIAAVGAAWRLLGKTAFYLFKKHFLSRKRIFVSCHCGCFWNGGKMVGGVGAVLSILKRLSLRPSANDWQVIRSLQNAMMTSSSVCLKMHLFFFFTDVILSAFVCLLKTSYSWSFISSVLVKQLDKWSTIYPGRLNFVRRALVCCMSLCETQNFDVVLTFLENLCAAVLCGFSWILLLLGDCSWHLSTLVVLKIGYWQRIGG